MKILSNKSCEIVEAMTVDEEFATIDLILASKAITRGVDAFTLALIKAERQMRKLFTYLVFQSDAFGADDVEDLRNVLASHRVYFIDFVFAWDKLYARGLKQIVGPEFDRLYAALAKATEHRNKIFHGQLTTHRLSRGASAVYCW